MTATVIPFARCASEAWDAYMALCHEAADRPELMTDAGHLDRRIAAHKRFFTLFARECAASRPARSA